MAEFVSMQYVKNLMRNHNAEFWRVRDSSGRSIINSCINGSTGINRSIELLQETIDNCEGEYVNVVIYTSKPEKKDTDMDTGNRFNVKVRLKEISYTGNNSVQKTNGSSPTWQDLIDMNNQLNEIKMEKFKNELEGTRNGSAAVEAFKPLIDKFANNDLFVNGIISAISNFGKPQQQQRGGQISGRPLSSNKTIYQKGKTRPQAQPQQPPNGNNNSDLNETIKAFAKLDPDYKNTLRKMAKSLEANPEQLAMIKQIVSAY